MNSLVASGGVLYGSYEGERTILRGKAALFAGEKIQSSLLCHLWQDGLWYTIHIRGWQGGKGEFVLGDICLVRGANVLF